MQVLIFVQALLQPINQTQKKYFQGSGGGLSENDRKMLGLLEQRVVNMLNDSMQNSKAEDKNDHQPILGKRLLSSSVV